MIVNADTEKVQRFLKHIALVYKNTKESETAKRDLRQHIRNIRQLSATKHGKDTEIRLALKELEDKMDSALAKEGRVVRHVYDAHSSDDELMKRLGNLEKQLGSYLEAQELRAKRVEELEARILQAAKRPELNPKKSRKR
jgi:hypothetical protein